MRCLRVVVLSFAAVLAAGGCWAADISARVLVKQVNPGSHPAYLPGEKESESVLHTAIYAPNLCVGIRNNAQDNAIALRGVSWAGYCSDTRSWLAKRYGSLAVSKDGATAVLYTMSQCASGPFETGVILPGEERLVWVPMTPQPNAHAALMVRYVRIGNWRKDLLLPKDEGSSQVTYTRPADDMIKARKGRASGDAIIVSMYKPQAKQAAECKTIINLKLPIQPDPHAKATGGITPADAAKLAGLNRAAANYLCFYRAPLQAWFFVKPNGSSLALAKKNGSWKKLAMPDMDPTVPDRLCVHQASKDYCAGMVLNPNIFGDIVKVSKPGDHAGWFIQGTTNVSRDNLWRILERARKRNLKLRLVTYDDNGLGNSTDLVVGVKLNSAGRWIDPKVRLREVP